MLWLRNIASLCSNSSVVDDKLDEVDAGEAAEDEDDDEELPPL